MTIPKAPSSLLLILRFLGIDVGTKGVNWRDVRATRIFECSPSRHCAATEVVRHLVNEFDLQLSSTLANSGRHVRNG